MEKLDLEKLYKKQISLTEWFEDIKHSLTEDLRSEDNEKRERLGELNKDIGLPYDKATQFPAKELKENSVEFKKFFFVHKNELCALRLIPNEIGLPKLRLRGVTISTAMDWFKEQKIDPKKYKADFVPHGDNQKYSTIFIVNKRGIFGEIIKGGHYQLTQGFYDQGIPVSFAYDFKTLKTADNNPVLKKYLLRLFKLLQVRDKKKQSALKTKFNAKFYNGYLAGYFETVDTVEFGLWFIDYNRILGEMYEDFDSLIQKTNSGDSILKGQVASHGKVRGKVKIIMANNLTTAKILEDEILVADMTTPDFLPLMKRSLGIITDLGGILSHAAIISRELNKPCITGTKIATRILKDGQMIEIDTQRAEIRIIP